MAVTIDGTNGINDIVLGSSTPAAATVTTFTSNGIDDNADALAITIDSSENVGIGTAVPGQPLEVFTGNGNNGIRINRFGSGVYYSDIIHADTPERLAFKVGTGAAIAERMAIKGDGNVGIGTASPTALRTKNLEVSSGGTNDGAAFIANKRGTGIASLRLATVGGADGWDINYNHPTSKYLGIYDIENAAYRMIFDTSGNVGIGTSSPASKVHIIGASNDTVSQANANLNIEGNGGNGAVIGTISSSPYSSYIQSGFVDNFATAVYPLILNPSGGNVGIGTVSPTALFHVSGASVPAKITSTNNALVLTLEQSSSSTAFIGTNGNALVMAPSSGTIGATLSATAFTVAAQPRFLVQRSSDQTNYVGSTQGQPVLYDNAVQNVGSHFNTATGLFTAPVAGMYGLQASAFTSGTIFTQGWLVINGSRAAFTDVAVSSTGGAVFAATWVHYLNANDTVGYHAYNASASNQTITANSLHTWFKGYLIS